MTFAAVVPAKAGTQNGLACYMPCAPCKVNTHCDSSVDFDSRQDRTTPLRFLPPIAISQRHAIHTERMKNRERGMGVVGGIAQLPGAERRQ